MQMTKRGIIKAIGIIKATMPPETLTMILKGRISYLDLDFH